ncbi:MAG: SprT family zinc-dependent metalloprotease [Hyphomicrobiaceae bacterium]
MAQSAKASPSARPSEAIRIEGLSTPVEIRRHPAARRMTLRVSRTRRSVVVTLPMSCDLQQAGRFLSSHIDWVRERLVAVPEPQPFRDGGLVPLRGEPHRICFEGPIRGPTVRVVPADDGEARGQLSVSGHIEHAPRRLACWLTLEARRDLEARVAWHAARLGVRYGRITVRDQSSRWGSCSSNGNLSFSWRLIMAPAQVLDYVAAHEVAHLREMNHGPRFWALVERTMPAMHEARRWLDAYGLDLHCYGMIDEAGADAD